MINECYATIGLIQKIGMYLTDNICLIKNPCVLNS